MNPFKDRLSVSSPDLVDKPAVPVHAVDGFHRRTVSEALDDSGIDFASFAKELVFSCSPGKQGHQQGYDLDVADEK